jgi:outer membrane receptor protein involved in Fe transport
VEYVEILSNPGARYDGEGINGVINIVLKKNAQVGTHGSALLGLNSQGGYNGSVNISHRRERLDVYGSYDHNQVNLLGSNAMREEQTVQKFKNGAPDGGSRVLAVEERDITSYNLKAGLKLRPWAGGQVRGEFLRGLQREDKDKVVDTRAFKADGSFASRSRQTENQVEDYAFNQYLLEYTQRVGQNGHLTTAYNRVDSDQPKPRTLLTQKLTEAGANLDARPDRQRIQETNTDRNQFAQADYGHRLGAGLSVAGGLKWSQRERQGEQTTEKFNYTTQQFVASQNGANNFFATEDIYAAYAEATISKGPVRAELGVRAEYTEYLTRSLLGDFQSQDSYLIPLPTANVYLNLDTTQYVKLSFGRRIRRASFKDLNPFEDTSDPTKTKAGNPALQPEKSWSYEVGYQKNFRRWSFGTNVFYRDIDGLIQKLLTERDGIQLERPDNFSGAYIGGLELIGAATITPWWALNGSYSRFTSGLRDERFEGGDALKDQFRWSGKAIQDVRLPGGMQFQLAWNAVGPKESSQKIERTLQFWDASLSKGLLHNRLQLNVRVSDLFNQNDKYTTDISSTQRSERVQAIPARQVFGSVGYNF